MSVRRRGGGVVLISWYITIILRNLIDSYVYGVFVIMCIYIYVTKPLTCTLHLHLYVLSLQQMIEKSSSLEQNPQLQVLKDTRLRNTCARPIQCVSWLSFKWFWLLTGDFFFIKIIHLYFFFSNYANKQFSSLL